MMINELQLAFIMKTRRGWPFACFHFWDYAIAFMVYALSGLKHRWYFYMKNKEILCIPQRHWGC